MPTKASTLTILLAGFLGVSGCSDGAGTAPPPVAPQPTVDPLSLVDPDLRAPIEAMQASGEEFHVDEASLPQVREGTAKWIRPPLDAPPVEEKTIPGPPAAPDLRVYVIGAARAGKPRPAVLHTHGGGYVIGTPLMDIPKLQQLAARHDCLVVSVDYRLAPETPYPGALEDNYAALKWLHANASALGVDPGRIAVMGESAGGGHAAALSIAARDRGEVPVAFQVLIYPMLDDRTGSTRPVPAHIGTLIWTKEANVFGWTSYLGVPAGSADAPEGAVPAKTGDLSGLPPTWIGVGAIDLFVQEDIEFARRLIEAGVPTELLVVPGAYHGFDIIAQESSGARAFSDSWNAALARAFAGTIAVD